MGKKKIQFHADFFLIFFIFFYLFFIYLFFFSTCEYYFNHCRTFEIYDQSKCISHAS